LRRKFTNAALHAVRNPLDEVGSIPRLNVQHLFVDLLRRHSATEVGQNCEVHSSARITGWHHIFVIEQLLGQLRNRQSAALLRSARSKRSKAPMKKCRRGNGTKFTANLRRSAFS
jgi:hypothetical protein